MAGLLCSKDPEGRGFKQQYGYFECRAKLPPGPGTWPAFWLMTDKKPGRVDDKWLEIDVMEQYGEATRYHIVRPRLGKGYHTSDSTILTGALDGIADMTADFHTYGCLVTPEQIVFYFDPQGGLEHPESAAGQFSAVPAGGLRSQGADGPESFLYVRGLHQGVGEEMIGISCNGVCETG